MNKFEPTNSKLTKIRFFWGLEGLLKWSRWQLASLRVRSDFSGDGRTIEISSLVVLLGAAPTPHPSQSKLSTLHVAYSRRQSLISRTSRKEIRNFFIGLYNKTPENQRGKAWFHFIIYNKVKFHFDCVLPILLNFIYFFYT